MEFKPFNKHLWIKPQEEEENKEHDLFIMPDEYKPAKSPYVIGEMVTLSQMHF